MCLPTVQSVVLRNSLLLEMHSELETMHTLRTRAAAEAAAVGIRSLNLDKHCMNSFVGSGDNDLRDV